MKTSSFWKGEKQTSKQLPTAKNANYLQLQRANDDRIFHFFCNWYKQNEGKERENERNGKRSSSNKNWTLLYTIVFLDETWMVARSEKKINYPHGSTGDFLFRITFSLRE